MLQFHRQSAGRRYHTLQKEGEQVELTRRGGFTVDTNTILGSIKVKITPSTKSFLIYLARRVDMIPQSIVALEMVNIRVLLEHY